MFVKNELYMSRTRRLLICNTSVKIIMCGRSGFTIIITLPAHTAADLASHGTR
jgi:hypothetical protein